jgi:hypothetical protein
MSHDYKRNGTTMLFAALNMLDSRVIGACMPRHRHSEFLSFLKLIDQKTPTGLDLHLIRRQRRHTRTQDPGRQAPDQSASSLPFALHADCAFLAQHGRALLRRDHAKPHPTRRLQERRELKSAIMEYLENHNAQSQALHLDQVRRRNPRKGRTGETSVRVTTLALLDQLSRGARSLGESIRGSEIGAFVRSSKNGFGRPSPRNHQPSNFDPRRA